MTPWWPALYRHAARHYRCGACDAAPKRWCQTKSGDVTSRVHKARVDVLDAAVAGVGDCPSESLESGSACVLPDHPAMHYYGHVAIVVGGMIGWS